MEMLSLQGKVAIVSGASSGIGAATAVLFSREGASVVLVGRNQENLRKVAADCGSVDRHLVIVADFRDPAQVTEVVEKTIAKYQRLDVLVNNAGAGRYGTIQEFTMDDFDWIMNLNVRSAVQLTQLALPHLIKSKGNVVNVSSVAGLNAYAGVNTYCMSKAALDQFTKCTALEVGPLGVRVNSVNPAVIVTEFHRTLGMDEQRYAEYLAGCGASYPLRRVGMATEVADAILYLARDSSSFLTGVLLPVSGGKHIDFSR